MSAQNDVVATNLSANAFTRVGHTFTGWNTAANGSGTSYADQASYPFTASVTLYAQWTINTTPSPLTLTGTGSMSNQSADYNVATNLTANAFTRTGYTFSGWNTAPTVRVQATPTKAVIPSLQVSHSMRSGSPTPSPLTPTAARVR